MPVRLRLGNGLKREPCGRNTGHTGRCSPLSLRRRPGEGLATPIDSFVLAELKSRGLTQPSLPTNGRCSAAFISI
jgi:hypothetical protein